MKSSALRIFSFCLSLVFALPLFCACNVVSGSSTSASPSSGTSTSTSTTTTTTAEPPLGDAEIVQNGSSYVARDLAYGERVDTSTKAKKSSSQLYDVYLPKTPDNLSADTPVMLFVHGGAWSDPNYDKSSDGAWIGKALAEKGMVVFSMNYVLQNSMGTAQNATVEDMLADIDAMISHMATLLPKLGIETDAIALGGNSAGAHLSSLYAYKCADTAALKIAFEVDIVGPTDLLTYKPVLEQLMLLMLGDYDLADAALKEAAGISFGLFFGMAGVTAGKDNLPAMWEKLREYSTVTYISENVCPTILAYAQTDDTGLPDFLLPAGFTSDGLVSTECYDEMVQGLTEQGVPFSARLFENTKHGDMWKTTPSSWIVNEIMKYAALYL